jgi:Zn-dependent M28 family amino/carboxypeptidase
VTDDDGASDSDSVTVSGTPLPPPSIAEMIAQVSETEIYNTVLDLQNFGTRNYGTQGNYDAGTYLFNRLSAMGLQVEYQGGTPRNIVATIPGTDPLSDVVYITGAHYDSCCGSDAPGAADNGGGCAIVMELARIMSQYSFNHTVKFGFWNDEETGMTGSYAYADSAKARGENIGFYYNFDSAVYDPNDRLVLDIVTRQYDWVVAPGTEWVADIMTEHNTLYSIGFDLTYDLFRTHTSDHKAFWARGFPALTIHTESHGPAHTPNDTVDKISTFYAKKNCQLGLSVLARLAEVSSP